MEGSVQDLSLGITLRSLGRKVQAWRLANTKLRECRPESPETPELEVREIPLWLQASLQSSGPQFPYLY